MFYYFFAGVKAETDGIFKTSVIHVKISFYNIDFLIIALSLILLKKIRNNI